MNILTWNICFGCMSADANSVNDRTAQFLAQSCQDERIRAGGTHVCLNNIVKHIITSPEEFDFICLQEATNWREIIRLLKQQTFLGVLNKYHNKIGYVHNKVPVNPRNPRGPFAEIITIYNKDKYRLHSAKGGNIGNDDGRPYIIAFFENKIDNDKIIIINLHNKHNYNKTLLTDDLSINLDIRYINPDINTIYEVEDISDNQGNNRQYILDNHNNFKVIMAGDFNDTYGSNYWNGFEPFKKVYFLPVDSKLKNIILKSTMRPPNSCCTGEYNIRVNGVTSDNYIGDYILVDQEQFEYENENIIPTVASSFYNDLTSDHLPVFSKIKLLLGYDNLISNFSYEGRVLEFENMVGTMNTLYKKIEKSTWFYIYILMSNTTSINNIVHLGLLGMMKCIKQTILKRTNIYDFDILFLSDRLKLDTEKIRDILLKLEATSKLYNFRYFLFNILKKANLVDDALKDDYINDANKLFYYSKLNGTNEKRLFIKLTLKSLFRNGLYYTNNPKERIRLNKNIIYYPISQLISASSTNQLNNISLLNTNNKISLDIEDFSNNHSLLIPSFFAYYLSSNISQLINVDINYEKLKLLSDVNNYRYLFLKNIKDKIDNNTINDSINELENELKNLNMLVTNNNNSQNLYLQNINILNTRQYLTIDTIMAKMINDTPKIIKNMEKNVSLIYDYGNCDLSNLFKDGSNNVSNCDVNLLLDSFKGIFTRHDIPVDQDNHGPIYLYSGRNYVAINQGLYNSNLGIPIADQAHQLLIDQLDTVFKNIVNDPEFDAKKYELLNDTFYLYRFQHYQFYDLNETNVINIPNLKVNDLLHFPSYLSTTFSIKSSAVEFLRSSTTVLLKIKMNRYSKDYVIIGNNSSLPQEREILLNKKMNFIVTGFSTSYVLSDGKIRDVFTISMEPVEREIPHIEGHYGAINLYNIKPESLFKENHENVCITHVQMGIITEYKLQMIHRSDHNIPIAKLGQGGNSEFYSFQLMNKYFAIKPLPIYGYRENGNLRYSLKSITFDRFNAIILTNNEQNQGREFFSSKELLENYEKPEYLNYYNREMNELISMKLCNILLEENITPNLPLMYNYYLCNNCTDSKGRPFEKELPPKFDNIVSLDEINYQSQNCFLLITERYNYTLRNVYTKFENNVKKLYLFHVLVGLYSMDYYFNIIHTDLHDKNILIKGNLIVNTDAALAQINDYDIYEIITYASINNGKYVNEKYEKFYVPHIGSYAIVWDWGRASIYQDQQTYINITRHDRGEILDDFYSLGQRYMQIVDMPWTPDHDTKYSPPPTVQEYKMKYMLFFNLFDNYKIEPSGPYNIKNTYKFKDVSNLEPIIPAPGISLIYPPLKNASDEVKQQSKNNYFYTFKSSFINDVPIAMREQLGGQRFNLRNLSLLGGDTPLQMLPLIQIPQHIKSSTKKSILEPLTEPLTEPKYSTRKSSKIDTSKKIALPLTREYNEKYDYTTLPKIMYVRKTIKIGNTNINLKRNIMYPIDGKTSDEIKEKEMNMINKMTPIMFSDTDDVEIKYVSNNF
jgi:hypothetical protein